MANKQGKAKLPKVDDHLRVFIDKELLKLSKRVAALTKDLAGLKLRLFQQQKHTVLKVPRSKTAPRAKDLDPRSHRSKLQAAVKKKKSS